MLQVVSQVKVEIFPFLINALLKNFQICLFQLMKMLISNKSNTEDYTLLVALCINEAINSKCAEVMCDNANLEQLMATSLAYQDILLMKLMRNLASHDSTQNKFLVSYTNHATLLINFEHQTS